MSVKTVSDRRECLSCGLCKAICPTGAIKLEYNSDSGFFLPTINDNDCVNCDLCEKNCPSRSSYGDKQTLIGMYRRLLLAHSSDLQVRKNSTSGGVVNTLVRYLIAQEIVDAALVVRKTDESEIGSWYEIITKDTVCSMQTKPRDYASRYVTVPLLGGLADIDFKKKKVAIVGTPCQIAAVDHLNCSGIVKIGIACSGGMSYKATEEYMRQVNALNGTMFYRGDGWPGKNSVVNGTSEIEYAHNGSPFERMFSSQIFKNPNCRKCGDHFAECADISFCDFWNTDEMQNEHIGNSCVIIRSEALDSIIDHMVTDNCIEIVKDLQEEEIIAGQRNVLKAKKGNLHSSLFFKLFAATSDYIFRKHKYTGFSRKDYEFFCRWYRKMCQRAKLKKIP